MGHKPGLGGFIVVRSDKERTVGFGILGVLRKLDGFAGIVGSSPGQYRYPAFDLIHADAHDPFVLVMRQGGGFARGAAGNKTVNALFDLPFDESAVRLFIDFTVSKWRH